MKEYSTFQERNEFEEQLFEVVQQYIDDIESYSNESENHTGRPGLCIDPKTLAVIIEYLDNVQEGYDFYPIEQFIRLSEDNKEKEPDCDATHELASSYCFIK